MARKDWLCPLRKHEAEATNDVDDLVIYCRDDCGWFNKLKQECSMVTIAQSLDALSFTAGQIEDILETDR